MPPSDFRSSLQEYHFRRIPDTEGNDRNLFGPVMPEKEVADVSTLEKEGLLGTLERFYYYDYSGMPPVSGILHDVGGVALALFLGASRLIRPAPALALATGVAFVPEIVNWSNGHLESGGIPAQAAMDIGKVLVGYAVGRFVGSRRSGTSVDNVINYDTSSSGRKPEWWPKG